MNKQIMNTNGSEYGMYRQTKQSMIVRDCKTNKKGCYSRRDNN